MKQIYMLRNEAIRNNAIDAILSIPIDDKSPHEVHIKEPKRSNPQNRLMWALLQDVSRQVLWHGQRLAPEDWKDLFTALWLKTKKTGAKKCAWYRRWRCHAWCAYQQNAKGQHD